MSKRPLSLTIIAWVLIVLSVLALVGVFTMGSNAIMMKAIEEAHLSLRFEQAWGTIGAIVSLICAYGILKGQPWSRVLYVVWSVISIIAGFYVSPMKATIAVNVVVLLVVGFFLFTEKANDWFQARGFMLKREVAPSQRR